MAKLFVVGLGPGGRENMTLRAIDTVKDCDVIVGYKPYLAYVEDLIDGKEIFSTGMRGEIERCKYAIEKVKEGKNTAILSTGDAGLYGMAGPILELADDIEVVVIPGVTAAFSAASELGSPIMHDYASISLSDLLTPWEVIMKRVDLASQADFVITLYNPRSKGRPDNLEEAINKVLENRSPNTPVGFVRNSGREGTEIWMEELGSIDYEKVDMMTVVIIGNSNTYFKDGKMVTPRGYEIK